MASVGFITTSTKSPDRTPGRTPAARIRGCVSWGLILHARYQPLCHFQKAIRPDPRRNPSRGAIPEAPPAMFVGNLRHFGVGIRSAERIHKRRELLIADSVHVTTDTHCPHSTNTPANPSPTSATPTSGARPATNAPAQTSAPATAETKRESGGGSWRFGLRQRRFGAFIPTRMRGLGVVWRPTVQRLPQRGDQIGVRVHGADDQGGVG